MKMNLSRQKKRQMKMAGIAGLVFGTAICPALWFNTNNPLSLGIIPISVLISLTQAYVAPEQ